MFGLRGVKTQTTKSDIMPDIIPTRWAEVLNQFLDSLVKAEKSPLTVRNYRRELRAFADWYQSTYGEGPCLRDLVADDLREYKDQLRTRKLQPATVNLALAALRALLKWAGETALRTTPIRAPKTVKQVRRTPRWLTKVQERKLLKQVRHGGDAHHLGLVEAFLVFGLRISEMASLEWSDITMGRTAAVLRVRRGKGAKERELPFLGNQRARDALLALGWKEHGKDKGRRILQGQRGPLSASGLKQLLTPYGRAADIDDFSAHVLRHTCAKRMLDAGAQLPAVARWLGHESLNTTMLYTLPSQEDLARAAGAGEEGWAEDD